MYNINLCNIKKIRFSKIKNIFIQILLDQTLDKLQKDLTEEKSNFEECKGKLELAEKCTVELQTSLNQSKGEIQKLQETVKRYC